MARHLLFHSTNTASTTTRARTSSGTAAASIPRNLGDPPILPPEIWSWIIQYIFDFGCASDLFSLYNTSTLLRTLTAPSLIQFIASKSVRLFFYQEYVCRTGVTFIFDHFDMTRDRAVFKPQQSISVGDNCPSNAISFRNGITIQRPQLVEISMKSRGSRFWGCRVQCSEEGIFSVRKDGQRPGSWAARTGNDGHTGNIHLSGKATTAARGKHLGPFAHRPENGFGSLEFLDRVCPLNIKRTGSRQLSGAQHSFGHNYPWTLHYAINSRKPCGNSYSVMSNDRTGNTTTTNGTMEADIDQHTPAGINMANSTAFPNSDPAAILTGDNGNSHAGSRTDSQNRRSRYMQPLVFECSINFLDPRRASRSLIRRWLEGKMSQLLQIVRVRQTTAILAKKAPSSPPHRARGSGDGGCILRSRASGRTGGARTGAVPRGGQIGGVHDSGGALVSVSA
ncbi:hypothetical protein EDD21DRAFT_386625 [Dissophora ornata]|nr:hypothetical protein EDD21DRAFT_386625 [Dissophora ornata]